MQAKKKILAINGSTRKNSGNHYLIKAIADITKDRFEIQLYESIATLPHFNPDEDHEEAAAAVKEFRQLLKNADGVIICTPEYAHGVPGSLKNAVDWTVGTNEFHQKPTLLITASTDGRYGHAALLETLKVIEAKDIEQHNLLIQFVKTKVNAEHGITDEQTFKAVLAILDSFENSIITNTTI
ncbi:MAG: NADPH-dependent FMN reductase [Ferruginibacter sp.]